MQRNPTWIVDADQPRALVVGKPQTIQQQYDADMFVAWCKWHRRKLEAAARDYAARPGGITAH